MATKDYSLSLNHTPINNSKTSKYSNINLNESYPSFFNVSETSNKSTSVERKHLDSDFANPENPHKALHTWNKTSQLNNLQYDSDKKDASKEGRNYNTTKNSTLSLHIEAHENSIEAAASNLFGNKNIEGLKKEKFESVKTFKQCFSDSLKSQNPFEFPRQQNGNQRNKPEVMQFKASQKFVDPDETLKGVEYIIRKYDNGGQGFLWIKSSNCEHKYFHHQHATVLKQRRWKCSDKQGYCKGFFRIADDFTEIVDMKLCPHFPISSNEADESGSAYDTYIGDLTLIGEENTNGFNAAAMNVISTIMDDQQAAQDLLNDSNDSAKRIDAEISQVERTAINVLKKWSQKAPPTWKSKIDVQSMILNISLIQLSNQMDPEIRTLFNERRKKLSKVANSLKKALTQGPPTTEKPITSTPLKLAKRITEQPNLSVIAFDTSNTSTKTLRDVENDPVKRGRSASKLLSSSLSRTSTTSRSSSLIGNLQRHAVIRDNSGIQNDSKNVATDDLTGGCRSSNIDSSRESQRPKDLQGGHVKPARCGSKTLDVISFPSSSTAAKRASKSLIGNAERYAKASCITAVNRDDYETGRNLHGTEKAVENGKNGNGGSNFGSSFSDSSKYLSCMDFELDDEIPDECFIQISAQFYSHLQKMAQIVVEDYTVELTCVSDYGDDGAVIRIYGPEAHSCYVTLHQMQQSFERFGMESSDCSDSLNMTAANYENEYERFCKKQLTQLLRDFNDSILVRKPVQ